MRLIIPTAVAVMLAGAAFAQGTAAPPNSTATPAMSGMQTAPAAMTPAPASGPSAIRTGTTAATAPAAGRNSFTMVQARRRITAAGYTGVAGLKKDGQGIWRAQAQKDGSPVGVAMDYQGNVTAQ